MRHLLFICLLLFCVACEENESVDPTIMPEATTTGANTFGCLVDGWVYTSGRWGMPSAEYLEREEGSSVTVSAQVGLGSYIRFTIADPKEGETLPYVNLSFENQFFSRFQIESRVVAFGFATDDGTDFYKLYLIGDRQSYFLLFVQCLRVLQEVLHPFVLLFPKDDLDRLVYGMRQFFRVDRLQQIVERTEADGLDRIAIVGGNENHFERNFRKAA